MIENRKSYAEEYIQMRKNYYAALALEKEEQQQSVQSGYRFLNYEKVIFERREVVPNQIFMMIPQKFEISNKNIVKFRLSEIDASDYIYTDENNEVHLTYNLFKDSVNNRQIDEIKKQVMERTMKDYSGTLMVEDCLAIGKRTISYFSFMIPRQDEDLFQLLYFMKIHNHLLIGGFHCGEYDRKEWIPAFLEMLATIEVM